jgi:hypothetical protein
LQRSCTVNHGIDPGQQRLPIFRCRELIQIHVAGVDCRKSALEPNRVANGRSDFMAVREQSCEQAGTDEAIRAQDENVHPAYPRW